MGKKVVTTTVPGAKIVSSAIVHLRGTSGSGKTTAMRAAMEMCGARIFELNSRKTKVLAYRGVINIDEVSKVFVYILGDYSPERSAGGCDTIPSIQELTDLVEKYGSRRSSIVVFEGLLASHSWGSLGEYVHPRWGKRYVNAFLDTPVETCIERVTERRASKGRETEGDRAAKIEKNIRDDYYRVELCHKRVIDRGGVLVDINHRRSRSEFTALVKGTAAVFCV